MRRKQRNASPFHPRDPRSRKHEAWKQTIAEGMREARLRRREAGYMTFTEVAVELCLPVRVIRNMPFHLIEVGSRRYIARPEVEQWKKQSGLTAA